MRAKRVPIVLKCWSCAAWLIGKLLQLVARTSERTANFMADREPNDSFLADLKSRRDRCKKAVIFFCSSAGEYEQAKPVLEAIAQLPNEIFVHVFFLSPSGTSFARAKDEEVSYSPAPIDTIANWQRVFRYLRPTKIAVVRHELWPAFLWEACRHGDLYLINCSRQGGSAAHTGLSGIIKSRLLPLFDAIFTVSDDDRDFLCQRYSLGGTRVQAVGDTKYDRALARASASATTGAFNRRTASLLRDAPVMVVGSAWPEDARICLDAYQTLRRRYADWTAKIVVVPHVPGDKFCGFIANTCDERGLTWARYTDIDQHQPGTDIDILVVDVIGILAEIYASGSWAWVGGAIHHQVHNVLEAASHALPTTFGPRYHNSHEAVDLVARGLCRPCRDSDELATWWQAAVEPGGAQGTAVRARVHALAGATTGIVEGMELDDR